MLGCLSAVAESAVLVDVILEQIKLIRRDEQSAGSRRASTRVIQWSGLRSRLRSLHILPTHQDSKRRCATKIKPRPFSSNQLPIPKLDLKGSPTPDTINLAGDLGAFESLGVSP